MGGHEDWTVRFQRELDEEEKEFIGRFLARAPARGPWPHMAERNMGNAMMAWAMRLMKGGSAAFRKYGMSLDPSLLTKDAFREDFRAFCTDRGTRLDGLSLDAVAGDVWASWQGSPGGFGSLADERLAFLDEYMTRTAPAAGFRSATTETDCCVAVAAWLRHLRDGKSVYLSGAGAPWDGRYTEDSFGRDVCMLARRYGSTMPRADLYGLSGRAWAVLSGEPGPMASGNWAADWDDREMDAFVGNQVRFHGYAGKYAEATARCLPGLLRGEAPSGTALAAALA